jgi:hypothetical protein
MKFARIRSWLHTPVIEDHSDEKPFRVRRGSVLLIMLGWTAFATACVVGTLALRYGMPVYSSFDFARGVVTEGGDVVMSLSPDRASLFAACKLLVRGGEVTGAILFSLGLASVVLWNRRDQTRTWRPRAL